MEKIQTIEQLDKVGIKICEMLNMGIDKASLVLPETMQQFIYYTIVSNSVICFLSLIVLGFLVFAYLQIRKSFPKEIDDPFICVGGGILTSGSIIAFILSSIELMKVTIAPNIVLIEKFSQLITK